MPPPLLAIPTSHAPSPPAVAIDDLALLSRARSLSFRAVPCSSVHSLATVCLSLSSRSLHFSRLSCVHAHRSAVRSARQSTWSLLPSTTGNRPPLHFTASRYLHDTSLDSSSAHRVHFTSLDFRYLTYQPDGEPPAMAKECFLACALFSSTSGHPGPSPRPSPPQLDRSTKRSFLAPSWAMSPPDWTIVGLLLLPW